MNLNRSNKTILIVSKGLAFGGAERLILNLSIKLKQLGYRILIVNISPTHNGMQRLFEECGLSILNMPTTNYSIIGTIYNLYKTIIQHQVEVVFAHLPVAGIAARVAALFARTRCIYVEHSLIQTYHPITKFLNYLTYPLSYKVVAVSQAVLESILIYLPKVLHPRLYLVKNGIDISQIERQAQISIPELDQISQEKLTIGTLASLRPVKRVDLLLKTFSLLLKKFPETHLIIGGDGPSRKYLEDLSIALGINKNVTFYGQIDCPGTLLRYIDIFVNCSEWEGLSLTILEAMCLKKPVIGTNVGGNPEIINDVERGILIDQNSEEQLFLSITKLIQDPDLRYRLGINAYKHIIENWDINQCTKKYEEILFS